MSKLEEIYKAKPFLLLKEYFMIALCTIPYAVVVNHILVPHAIVGGGLTGYCEILYFASHRVIPIWASSATMNVLLLIAAYFAVGKRYVLRTLFGVFWLTFWLKVIPVLEVPIITDPFMAVVLGGIFNGTALGLVFLNNGSTGGTDIVAMILRKYTSLNIGLALLCTDTVITVSACFAFGMETGLFSILGLTVKALFVDMVMDNLQVKKCFQIITSDPEPIERYITQEIHRGATQLHGEGVYTHEGKTVLMTVVSRHEAVLLRNFIRQNDPGAFMIITSSTEIIGKGFRGVN